jgi:hypothetical protein
MLLHGVGEPAQKSLRFLMRINCQRLASLLSFVMLAAEGEFVNPVVQQARRLH